MTIADHLRAVLGVLDAKAFRTPAQQDVIEAARTALEQHRVGTTVVYGDSFADDEPRMRQREAVRLIAEAKVQPMLTPEQEKASPHAGLYVVRDRLRKQSEEIAHLHRKLLDITTATTLDNLGRNLTIAAAHAVADDRKATAKRMDALRKFDAKSAKLVQTESEFESAMSDCMQAIARGSVERDTANMRFALHQAIIAQDVASVPQERAKSECAPPPGVTQERAATGTVERSTACDIVARSLVKGRETQKLALSTYGREAQQDQAIEECAELIVALRHYQRGVGSLGELQGEIADVLVTVTTLAIQYGDEAIAACVDYKLDRLRKRLGGL